MTATKTVSIIPFALGLLRPFWPLALVATFMGALSGLATAWLLATINAALHHEGGATPALLWAFAGLCVIAVAGEIISDLGNSQIGQQIIASLRKQLVEQIIVAPIDRIERFRTHRLMATLNQDVETLSGFTFAFSSLAIALAVTLGSAAYLVVLSPSTALVVGLAIVAGSTAHALARRAAREKFDAARAAQDDLHLHYRAITDGAKELRINRMRRSRVHRLGLVATIDRIGALRIHAMRLYMSANALGSSLFFIVIGVVLAFRTVFGVSNEVLSGVVLVLLYVKGPVQQLVASLPILAQAQVALGRVAELSERFASPEPGLLMAGERAGLAPSFETIELRDIAYVYPGSAEKTPFVLGPINLTIAQGEVLFIVGENGSGKTTLIKLILSLYEPASGTILLGGKPVAPESRDEYRQLFSAIFFDYFLFDDLMPASKAIPASLTELLVKLDIDDKVEVRDDRFSTIDLSAGQRKRLALVQIYLEDRPVIVFDEWAAEQDPTFRRLFYAEILPELKSQNKTLIVVSHDDRYFGAADRIAHIEDGKIVEMTQGLAASTPWKA